MQEVMIEAFNKNGFDIFENETGLNGSGVKEDKSYVKITQKDTGLSYITEDIKTNYYVMTDAVDSYVNYIKNDFNRYSIEIAADYDDVKNFISVQLANRKERIYDENATKRFGDLLIVPVFGVNNTEIIITSKLLKTWNKTLEEIFSIAYENMKGGIFDNARPETNLRSMGLTNQQFGAIAPLINFDWLSELHAKGEDAILAFPNALESTVASLAHGVIQNDENKIYKSWYDYLLLLLRECNMYFSFCIGIYDCEKDSISFGDDSFTVSELKQMFGAE